MDAFEMLDINRNAPPSRDLKAEEAAFYAARDAGLKETLAAIEAYSFADQLVEAGAWKKDVDLLVGGTIKATPAIDAVANVGGDTIVVLSGSKGSGKSTAIALWLRNQLRAEAAAAVSYYFGTARWYRDADLMRAMPMADVIELVGRWRLTKKLTGPVYVTAAKLARWSKYDDAEMNRLLRASALAIDDLGVEFSDVKGSFLSLLNEVVDARYGNKLPTVGATNLTGEDFKARYEERLVDRIREAGSFINVSRDSMRAASKSTYANNR